jgi:hypothetical protein
MANMTSIRRPQLTALQPKQWPTAPGVKIYEGAVIGRYPSGTNQGCIDNIGADPSLVCEGIARNTVDNSASSSPGPDVFADEKGWLLFASGLDQSAEGQPAYAVDNQTFSLSSNGGLRPLIGYVHTVRDATSAWVQVGPGAVAIAQARIDAAGASLMVGSALTDANATVQRQGRRSWFTLPASTLTTGRTLTLGTTGAQTGDTMLITRLDATANTYSIANGGAGAGTLGVLPVSKVNFLDAIFDGTNWKLLRLGTQ